VYYGGQLRLQGASVDFHGIDDSTEACDQIWQTCADTRHPATTRVIALFRESLEKVQSAELERLNDRLPKLNERSRLEIRQFAERLVAKMFDPPVESLRDESHNGSPNALLEALQRLFQLHD
jgi:glutamyl-tRNA reductase